MEGLGRSLAQPYPRARKRHINFEHINFLKIGTTLGHPPRFNQREKFIFPVFRGEHINFLARLTLGQRAVCPRVIWTLTRAKSLCLCAFFLPDTPSPPRCAPPPSDVRVDGRHGPWKERGAGGLQTECCLWLCHLHPDLQNSPTKIGVWWVARLKFSISIENFNPRRRS